MEKLDKSQLIVENLLLLQLLQSLSIFPNWVYSLGLLLCLIAAPALKEVVRRLWPPGPATEIGEWNFYELIYEFKGGAPPSSRDRRLEQLWIYICILKNWISLWISKRIAMSVYINLYEYVWIYMNFCMNFRMNFLMFFYMNFFMNFYMKFQWITIWISVWISICTFIWISIWISVWFLSEFLKEFLYDFLYVILHEVIY